MNRMKEMKIRITTRFFFWKHHQVGEIITFAYFHSQENKILTFLGRLIPLYNNEVKGQGIRRTDEEY